MAKINIDDVLKGVIKPVAALSGGSGFPLTTADQVWVYTDANTHQSLDEYLTARQTGTAEITQVFVSNATELGAGDNGPYVPASSIVAGDSSKCKVGDIVFVATGNVYKVRKGIVNGNVGLEETPIAAFGTSAELKKVQDRVSAVEGYFDNGVAKNASQLNGHGDDYFATKESVDGLASSVNGKSSIYVFDDEAARKKALAADANKYKVGDTLLLVAKNVPDYWISSKNETAAEGSETGVYVLSELETKVDIAASGIQAAIDSAKDEAVASAKTYTDTTVDALKNGDVKSALDKANTNASDIAKIKAPVVSASALAAGAAPTASVTAITEGENAGKLSFEFGIPAGAKGDKGDAGAAGAKGHGIYLAKIDVQSSTDVNLTDLVNSDGIAVGDTIFDNNGDAYTVTTLGEDKVHVSAAIEGFNIKGPKGDKGETGEAGAKGDKGDTGATPVITATATVDDTAGTPSVTVTKKEDSTAEAPAFEFAFSGLKGSDADVTGTVVPTTDVGNLKKNVTYKVSSLQDLLNKRLVSYVAASSGQGSTKPNNGGTFEDGATVNITGMDVSAIKGSTAIVSIGANDGTKDYTVQVDSSKALLGDRVGGTITFDKPVALTSNKNGFSWWLTYVGEDGKNVNLKGGTGWFFFKDKIYWGTGEASLFTADSAVADDCAATLALSDNGFYDDATKIDIGKFGTLEGTKYLYVVVNASSKALSIHTGLGDSARLKIKDFDFTNASGKTKSFSIYRSANAGIALNGSSIVIL